MTDMTTTASNTPITSVITGERSPINPLAFVVISDTKSFGSVIIDSIDHGGITSGQFPPSSIPPIF